MAENVQLIEPNCSLGPAPVATTYYYSASYSLQQLRQVTSDGTPVDLFPVNRSFFRNPVKELHYDGTYFWTLENLPSSLGIVIKRWRLYPFKTYAFPSVTPSEFRWYGEITLLNKPTMIWEADAFAVEHYHRSFDGSFSRGASTIKLNSVVGINIGQVLELGPSDFGGFEGNEESITVAGVNSSTREVSFSKAGGLENSYLDSDPVDFVRSVYVFSKNSFTGTADDQGSLVKFSWPSLAIVLVDTKGRYNKVGAADFDSTKLVWVRGLQLLQLNTAVSPWAVESSIEANLLEDDLSTPIEVFDIIADLDSNVIYKLQDRETSEDAVTGEYTTTIWAPSPQYNLESQNTLAQINSLSLAFDTRYALPFSSGDQMQVVARLRDQYNFPVEFETIQFSASLNALSDPGDAGSFSPATSGTDADGRAQSTYVPSATTNDVLVDIQAKSTGAVARPVVALVEQRAGFTTNPNGESPDPSRPVEQIAGTSTSDTTESLMEQRISFSTSSEFGTSTSAPIEQKAGDSFSTPTTEPPDDCIIEQKAASTAGAGARGQEDYDGNIQQLIFTSESLSGVIDNLSTRPIEQRTAERATPNSPIEQTYSGTRGTTNIEQYNFIQEVFPPCGSVKNPVNTNLLWRIRDFGSTFDVATLIFRVNGVEVQDTSDFTVEVISNGLRLFYDPPVDFDYDSYVEVYVQVSDTADPVNTFFAYCNFYTVPDTRPPIIENLVPACGSTGVDVLADVEFDVRDTGLGVDQDSIVLNIEGLPVCSGLSFTSLTTVSGNGYHVTWTHAADPFIFDANITVAISATDLSPLQNSTLFVCSFDTEESSVPVFINFDPEPCETFVDNTTGLSFEVYGVEHGIDISTLEVRVDNALRKVYVRPKILRSE